MSKINLSDNAIEIPSDKIGIDMGQSLSKIAYLDNNKLTLSSFATHTRLAEIKTLLNAKKDQFRMFNFTGGRSFELYTEYSKDFKDTVDFARLNIIDNQNIALKYGVMGTPTFKFFCKG